MKIFDKIKDLFTDEIIEESEEIIEVKKEEKVDKLPSVMREEKKLVENEEKNIINKDLFNDFDNLEVENNSGNNFRFPITFEESDFLDDKILSNQNVMFREREPERVVATQTYNEPYQKKEKKEEKVTFFKVSPVISPVYGILDKNYKKDEVQSKPKTSKDIIRNNQKVDFESVRKKAYGSLIDDIKDNLSSVKIEDKKEDKEDIYKLNESINDITLGDVESNFADFGITIDEYKKNNVVEDVVDVKSFEEKRTPIEVNGPVIDLKKQDEDFEKVSSEGLNDDIFNLIDDMYNDKEEDND